MSPVRFRGAYPRREGFTLIEVLAAMVIMAIVLPVLVEGAMLAGRASTLAERERRAALLADAKLTEAIVTGTWQDGDASGDFDGDYPGYTWTLTTQAWGVDTMRQVTMAVQFESQGEVYTTRLDTLVDENQAEEASSS